MTDLEFDVLDELYFVQPYTYLKDTIALDDRVLLNILQSLLRKGWLKVFVDAQEELNPQEVDLDNNYRKYFYLASKAGLLAHNGRD